MAENRKPNRLRVACEIASDHVVAARVASSHDYLEALAGAPLAAGVVAPSLSGTNVVDGGALRAAVRSALSQVSDHARDVILVLPDAAVRVFLLDFDELPARPDEVNAVVRFRLRKALPFDVERATVSFQVQKDPAGIRVLAAVVVAAVAEEYESAVRDAGYNPGVVLPSTIAALGLVDAGRPTLVLKLDPLTTSVAIVADDQVRLFRMLEHPTGLDLERELGGEIYPSLVFFQDTYAARVDRVLVGGSAAGDAVVPVLETQTGAQVKELVPGRYLGNATAPGIPRPALAGVVGALVG
jgi:type IV pilus assembly protein PilM